ncbi:hypothetical protein Tco_0928965 [Tanacetum coccineum]
MSSVLGSSVSFVTSGSFSTTGGEIGGPSYEAPLRMVIALASFLGFGMVLLGNELELEAWNRYLRKGRKRSQNDKTRHGMEKRGKDKVKSKPKV